MPSVTVTDWIRRLDHSKIAHPTFTNTLQRAILNASNLVSMMKYRSGWLVILFELMGRLLSCSDQDRNEVFWQSNIYMIETNMQEDVPWTTTKTFA